jgi:hypothetical protein
VSWATRAYSPPPFHTFEERRFQPGSRVMTPESFSAFRVPTPRQALAKIDGRLGRRERQ